MSTVDKALTLLRHFSVQTPELGLSELTRLAGDHKTTVLRCMTALERNGFVEQDPVSRKYRLGLAPINLAQIREQSFPVRAVLKRFLDVLAADLEETAHATLIINDELMTAGISEPDRALRVHLDPSEVLPVHATASGIAVAAFLPKDAQDALLASPKLARFTPYTLTDASALRDVFAQCRREGLGRAAQTYERDVIGTAAPFFGPAAQPIGAVAVAAVSSRLTPGLQTRIDTALRKAAADITQHLGGLFPAEKREPEEITS